MFAITAITGQVGGVVARQLLNEEKKIRAVLRNKEKAKYWSNLGCEISVADMNDIQSLAEAFTDVKAVFILLPPLFDPSPGFPEARCTINAIKEAIAISRPPKVVCLSTIGADCTRPNLLTQLQILEQELSGLSIPITFLRAAWFMENFAWDVNSAVNQGVIHSLLQPLDKLVPMVSVEDVGRVAADLLQEEWEGKRIVNFEAIYRLTPNNVAASFSKLLRKPVNAVIVPRDTWHNLFESQGMKNPEPRIQMLDGFNQGWIEFDNHENETRTGNTTIDLVLEKLLGLKKNSTQW